MTRSGLLTNALILTTTLLPLPQTWAGAIAGPHPVGVTRLTEGAHLLALVWRPVANAAPPMTLAGLASLACPEVVPGPDAAESACLPLALASAASQRLLASAGGTPVPGRRPLVVLSAGLNAIGIELSSLAETLASHGYVAVVMAAPPAPRPRAFDAAQVRLTRAALGRTVDRMRDDPGVDNDRLVLAAWSFGGVPAVLEAAVRPSVRAVISLDSALRYEYGAGLIRDAGLDPTAYRGALLSVSAGVDNSVVKDEGVIDAMTKAAITRIVADGVSHADLTDLGGAMRAMTWEETERRAFQERYRRALIQVVDWLRRVVPPLIPEAADESPVGTWS